jgi:nucleoside-diphosphate-sugar epimerase
MRVLLTGATGLVGRHTASERAGAGHDLRCLVRSEARAAHLAAAGHELVVGDLSDRGRLGAAVAGTDAVVHVAGLVRARSAAELTAVNAAGAARLASAAAEAVPRPQRYVLISSQAAAGPSTRGLPRAEVDPPRPVSDYGRSKLGGETGTRRALGGRIPLTIVRPPSVYGPFDTDIFEFFVAAARGVRLAVGTRERRVSAVHAEDLASGIRLALETPEAAGRTYFVANDEEWPISDLLAAIAHAVRVARGRDPSLRGFPLRVPEPVLQAAGALVEEVARLRGRAPTFSRDKAREFLARGWLCDAGAARRDLGWTPARTVEEGLLETARWYVEQGWLPA